MEDIYATKILTNDELGRLHRLVDDIKGQICDHRLEYNSVLDQLRVILKKEPLVKQSFV